MYECEFFNGFNLKLKRFLMENNGSNMLDDRFASETTLQDNNLVSIQLHLVRRIRFFFAVM